MTHTMRARLALLAAPSLVLGSAACDGLFVAPAPSNPMPVAIAFDLDSAAGNDLQAFGRADAAHIRLQRRSDGSVAFDGTVALVETTGGDLEATIEVELVVDPEVFDLAAHLMADGQALFEGLSTVTVGRGTTVATVPLQAIVATVAIAESGVLMTAIGATTQLHAAALFSTGDTASAAAIAWTSRNQAVADVAQNGVVTARGEGVTRIVASVGTVSAELSVQVAPLVANVVVTPANAALIVGDQAQLTAVAQDANGHPLSRVPQWQSDAPIVASVDSNGRVEALSAGEATITATVEGRTGTATITVMLDPVETVTVTPSSALVTVGETALFTATLRTASGTVVVRPVTWISSDPTVAAVDVDGTALGLNPGSAVIRATSEGVTGDAQITVDPAVLLHPDLLISSTPSVSPTTVAAGSTVMLSSWAVTNQGTVGAGPFTIGFYLSTDAYISPADTDLGGVSRSGLAAGLSFTTGGVSLTIPSATPPGNYWIGLYADRAGQVTESDESNNGEGVPLTVTAGTLSIANYRVSIVKLNDPTCTNLGTRFAHTFDYSDPVGTVSTASAISADWYFEPTLTSGSFTTPPTGVTGMTAGTVTFETCTRYVADVRIHFDVTLTDDQGHVSNGISITIDRPVGANSPDPASTASRNQPVRKWVMSQPTAGASR